MLGHNKIKTGKVYLVGAGPGDAALLTIKAIEILQKADVVIYDRLVSKEIISKIPESAEKINVGKNSGNHPISQSQINEIIYKKALENNIVVRLKGGDPFLFGRGGEELELLHTHNIDFCVVPGVTSAIAAAAYAGIPVTHRDFCSSLHIITGHAKKNGVLNIDYKSLVNLKGTLIFMMSVSTMPSIALGLIKEGMDKNISVAVVENGTTNKQRKFLTTLEDIEVVIKENNIKSPSTIIVGKVCELSNKFDWFSDKVLKGCRVLVTRPKESTSKMVTMLDELGADITVLPCIETHPIDFNLDIKNYNWIVFTSATGVNCFFNKLKDEKMDSRNLFDKKIAVVGTQTATELLKYGIVADFIPKIFDGEHLALELLENNLLKENHKVAIFRAKKGSDGIINVFQKNKINFSDISTYETKFVKQMVDIQNFDFFTFTSASTVEGFVGCFDHLPDFSKVNAICIGKQTEAIAKKYGMKTNVSEVATIKSMTDKIVEVFNAN